VRALVIDGDNLKAILRERPEAAMAMLATLAERISAQQGSTMVEAPEYLALRDVGSATIALPAAAIVALEADRPEDAAVLLGAFEGLSERFGVRPPARPEAFLSVDPYERVAELLDPEELAPPWPVAAGSASTRP
jgi:hypothetical protein